MREKKDSRTDRRSGRVSKAAAGGEEERNERRRKFQGRADAQLLRGLETVYALFGLLSFAMQLQCSAEDFILDKKPD